MPREPTFIGPFAHLFSRLVPHLSASRTHRSWLTNLRVVPEDVRRVGTRQVAGEAPATNFMAKRLGVEEAHGFHAGGDIIAEDTAHSRGNGRRSGLADAAHCHT